MYYIKKYADCWAIHNDDNGRSRRLTEQEIVTVKYAYPLLTDPKVRTIYADKISCLEYTP